MAGTLVAVTQRQQLITAYYRHHINPSSRQADHKLEIQLVLSATALIGPWLNLQELQELKQCLNGPSNIESRGSKANNWKGKKLRKLILVLDDPNLDAEHFRGRQKQYIKLLETQIRQCILLYSVVGAVRVKALFKYICLKLWIHWCYLRAYFRGSHHYHNQRRNPQVLSSIIGNFGTVNNFVSNNHTTAPTGIFYDLINHAAPFICSARDLDILNGL